MTDRTPVIGIAPLNPNYRLVSKNTLASFELHQVGKGPRWKEGGGETKIEKGGGLGGGCSSILR